MTARKSEGHRVADISFRKQYVRCDCGKVVKGDDPEQLYVEFGIHRRKELGSRAH